MRAVLMFFFAAGLAACQADQPLASKNSITGTYVVTRLTQYQHATKTFDGYLPYLAGDTMTITHTISVENLTLPETDAFIFRELTQTVKNTTRHVGRNIGGPSIRIKETASPFIFEFYRDGTTKIGQYEKGLLFFDLVENGSLNQPVRYVFQAKKISDLPNRSPGQFWR